MNARIKELLDASKVAVWDTNDYNGSPEFLGYEIDQEKFANLIISECVDRCKNQVMKWIEKQAYSGSSHVTDGMGNPDWLDMTEMRKYMPSTFADVKKYFENT